MWDLLSILVLVDLALFTFILVQTLRIIFDARKRVVAGRFTQSECDDAVTMLEGDTTRFNVWQAFAPNAKWAYGPRIKALYIAFVGVAVSTVCWLLYMWFMRERGRLHIGVMLAMIVTRYSLINIFALQIVFGKSGREGTIASLTLPIDAEYTRLKTALASAVSAATAASGANGTATAFSLLPKGYQDELVQRYLMINPDETNIVAVADKLNTYIVSDQMKFIALTNPYMDRQWSDTGDGPYAGFFRNLGRIKDRNLFNPEVDMRVQFSLIEFNTWTIGMVAYYGFVVLPVTQKELIGTAMYGLKDL